MYINNNTIVINHVQLIDINKNNDYEYVLPYKNIENLNISSKDNLGDISYSIIENKLNEDYIIENNIGKLVSFGDKIGNIINKKPLLVDSDGKIYSVKFEELVFDIDNILKPDIVFDRTNIVVNVNSPIRSRIKINNYFSIKGLNIVNNYELHMRGKNNRLINKATILNNTKYNFNNIDIYAYSNVKKQHIKYNSIKNRKSLIKVKSKVSILGEDVTINSIAKKATINNNSKNTFVLSGNKVKLRETHILSLNNNYKGGNIFKISKYLNIITNTKIKNNYINIYDKNQYLGNYIVKDNFVTLNNLDVEIVNIEKIGLQKYKVRIKNNSKYSLSIRINSDKIEAKEELFYISPDSFKEIEITKNR
jgi:hypothetical protein